MTYREQIYSRNWEVYLHDSIKIRKIIHCECEHILYANEKCTERIFNCYDLINNEFIDIHVCNEWFKLNLKKYLLQNIYHSRYIADVNILWYETRSVNTVSVGSFIYNEIIDKYIEINLHKRHGQSNTLLDRNLGIKMCYRPCCIYNFSLKDGIDLLINNTMAGNARNGILSNAITRTLDLFLSTNKYKKYSTIERQFNKLAKTYNKQDEEYLVDFNELLINILNIK